MEKKSRRALPWALMALGAALALIGLGMLGQTPKLLQYGVAAPEPGDRGLTILERIEEAQGVRESLSGALSALAVGGVKERCDLSAGDRSAAAALWAMDEGWLEACPRVLRQGRRISETELREGARVAMLDEDLAFSLFGTEMPEDARVTLAGQSYQVVGTVRHAGSLTGGRGVGDGEPMDVYAPLKAVSRDGMQLDVLTLTGKVSGASGAAQQFDEAARAQWLDGGTTIDLQKEAMRRTMMLRILALVAGIYALVGLFRRMTALCAGWFAGYRAALQEQYFNRLIPRLAGILALSALGYGALAGLGWLMLSFSARPLYVFTEWVPDNIVSWSSLSKVFWGLTASAAGLIRVGSRELRQVEFWGGMVRWGLALFLLGAALRPRKAAKEK